MCQDPGVVLEFLPLYSPDFNPIEYFGVLKKFIKKKWHENEDFIAREFKMFLEWYVDMVGVAGVLWRRHMKTLTTTFLSGNGGKQSHPLFQWFAERSKQHIRCLAAPPCVELLF
jgi:hypothetical protein